MADEERESRTGSDEESEPDYDPHPLEGGQTEAVDAAQQDEDEEVSRPE